MGFFINVMFYLALSVFSAGLFAQSLDPVKFDLVTLSVNAKTVKLEYAHSFKQRARGLMHRESMCGQCGMLFNFKQIKRASMWMKNTLIPLDVAFIRKDGVITDIKTMQAHDLTPVGSSEEVLYAWEMNVGWFKENAIAVGDTVFIQP
ncbi:MAG: uncharacterized membrane protein (UPF0127 family) [Paraglaciecola sp.]|jgi:uncharacterized membrane protein (UPF0127 family)